MDAVCGSGDVRDAPGCGGLYAALAESSSHGPAGDCAFGSHRRQYIVVCDCGRLLETHSFSNQEFPMNQAMRNC